MSRVVPAAIVLLALAARAQDVFVPPKLKGVKEDGKVRTVRPVAFPEEKDEWALVRSKHYVFISSAGTKRTREVAEDLETLASALSRVNPQFKAEATTPTRVIIFNSRREAQPYFDLLLDRDNANVSGVYVAQKQGGSMLMSLTVGGWNSDRTPYHELIHNLIANSGATPPLWLDEGLAEYFSNADVRKGLIRAGAPVPQHLATLRLREFIPLERIFRVVRESDTYNMPNGQRAFYAESWSAVEWLVRNGGQKQEKFYAFMGDVSRGTPVETALQTHYAKSIQDVENAIRSYSGMGRFAFGLNIPVTNVDTTTTTTKLDRADILYELGKFLAGVQSSGSEPERHFRAALQVNPRHARAMAAIGDIQSADANYEKAIPYYDQALAADPSDPLIHLAYAEALLQTQIGPLAESNTTSDEDVPRFRKARELASKAIALNTPELARAYGDLGITYIIEKNSDLAPGIAALEKARELAPARIDFAVHLYAMYRRTGDRAKADPLFKVLDAARNPHVSYAARAVSMRVELSRANDLLKANDFPGAARVIRALAQETIDDDAKKDLERQANEIVKVAEQNRQIDVYNKAVGQVNSGDYKTAMKTLTELLQTATDPGVIRDAQNLRKKLQARK